MKFIEFETVNTSTVNILIDVEQETDLDTLEAFAMTFVGDIDPEETWYFGALSVDQNNVATVTVSL